MIRITQISEGSKRHLIVEGTLSDKWVDALETAWLEAQPRPAGEPISIDLSGVTYVDDKGRELLTRMIRGGAALLAAGLLARAVIEEITKDIKDRPTKKKQKNRKEE